jgi:hypothetical protein
MLRRTSVKAFLRQGFGCAAAARKQLIFIKEYCRLRLRFARRIRMASGAKDRTRFKKIRLRPAGLRPFPAQG